MPLTYVFPVYFDIDSGWAFLLLGIGFLICAALTLAPLGRRKRLTVAAEAEAARAGSASLDELEHAGVPDHPSPRESRTPELEHDDRPSS
jgi:UDP-GlcNAc:undecaprenyl-phosphate GlcNAc-1-phosphate transferase